MTMMRPMLNVRKPPGLRGEAMVSRSRDLRIVSGNMRPFQPKIIGARGDARPVVKAGRDASLRGRAIAAGFAPTPPKRPPPLVVPSDIHFSKVGTASIKRFRGVGARGLPFRAIGNLGGMMGFHTGD